MSFDLVNGVWLNPPNQKTVTEHDVSIVTEANTDFWQRSFYGFRNENAPAYLFESVENYTFTTKVNFNYQDRFDQAGIIVFLDNENWFKASIEYEMGTADRLGSVVTNMGYSDWATTDISSVSEIWYRLSRRGPDFLVESSFDGSTFNQMRVFHLHLLGETTAEMGAANPPLNSEHNVRFGVYACSPVESSFTAHFSKFGFEPSIWKAHE